MQFSIDTIQCPWGSFFLQSYTISLPHPIPSGYLFLSPCNIFSPVFADVSDAFVKMLYPPTISIFYAQKHT